MVGVLHVLSDESLWAGVSLPVHEKPIEPFVHMTVVSCMQVDWA